VNEGDGQQMCPNLRFSSFHLSRNEIEMEIWDEEGDLPRGRTYRWPMLKFPSDFSFDPKNFWGRDQLYVKDNIAVLRFITEGHHSLSGIN